MRLLIDEDVDVGLIRVLKRTGHDVIRVPSGSKNGSVIALARDERRVLVTRDSDFADIARYPPARHFGIIHLRIHPPWLGKLAAPLQKLLSSRDEGDFAGKLFIVEESGYRCLP